MTTRRNFVATLAAVAGGAIGRKAIVPLPGSLGNRAKKLDRIGIQLYSVRDLMAKDFAGTITQIAQVGYKEVEFAGFYNNTPAAVKQLLQSLNITAPSAHVGFDQLGANWNQTLNDLATIGAEYATCPWTPEEQRGGTDQWKRVADKYNEAGRIAKTHGLGFAYHNHAYEFEPCVGNAFPFQILLDNTDPALVNFEMDVYWVTNAGQKPVEWINRYPTRFPMLHLKDGGPAPDHKMTDVGSGTIDFASILRADAAMKHAFVEKDEQTDPMAFARNSFNYLHNLNY